MQFQISSGFHRFLRIFVVVVIIFVFLFHLIFRCLNINIYLLSRPDNQLMMIALIEMSYGQKGMLRSSEEENGDILENHQFIPFSFHRKTIQGNQYVRFYFPSYHSLLYKSCLHWPVTHNNLPKIDHLNTSSPTSFQLYSKKKKSSTDTHSQFISNWFN